MLMLAPFSDRFSLCEFPPLRRALGLSSIEIRPRSVRETHFSHNEEAKNKVVVMTPRSGTILSGEGFIKRQIDQAKKDERCQGRRPARQFARRNHHRKRLYLAPAPRASRKERDVPIVDQHGLPLRQRRVLCLDGCVGDTPDSIFAEPTTWTGSIGVVIPHLRHRPN